MRPIGYLLVLSAAAAMAAAAPQAGGGLPTKSIICDMDECTCGADQNGLELVTCDCSEGGSGRPLMLGALSHRTRSLRVRSCSHVSLVSDALSNAIQLTDLELSDIARLKLQSNSLYTDNGPLRRVTVKDVADLQMDPQALNQVTRLQQLELSDLVAGHLPLDSFAAGAEVQSVRLVDSVAQDVSIKLGKAGTVHVADCSLNALSVDVGAEVQSVRLVDSVAQDVSIKLGKAATVHVADCKLDALSVDVGAEVRSVRLVDSVAQDVTLKLGKAATVHVADCTLNALSVDVGDVLSVTIADNAITRMGALRINVRNNAHSTDTNVTIENNAITAMDSEEVQMTLDKFALVDNALSSLMAPLRIKFTTATVTGNAIGRLGPAVFDEFIRVGPTLGAAAAAFTFVNNTLGRAVSGSYGRFLTPADEQHHQDALYRVYGNRFVCRCEELKELVRVGEAFLNVTAEDNDGLFELPDVYGELYRTSKCVKGDQKLEQYRLTAYTTDFECRNEENGATSAFWTPMPAASINPFSYLFG